MMVQVTTRQSGRSGRSTSRHGYHRRPCWREPKSPVSCSGPTRLRRGVRNIIRRSAGREAFAKAISMRWKRARRFVVFTIILCSRVISVDLTAARCIVPRRRPFASVRSSMADPPGRCCPLISHIVSLTTRGGTSCRSTSRYVRVSRQWPIFKRTPADASRCPARSASPGATVRGMPRRGWLVSCRIAWLADAAAPRVERAVALLEVR